MVVAVFFSLGSSASPCLLKQTAPNLPSAKNRHSEDPAYKDAVTFAKIDVDAVPDVAADLGIRAMPTFLLFKDGAKADELLGANPQGLEALVKKAI